MRGNRLLSSLIGFTCLFISSFVLAYDEPIVNLGYTSFFDGGPPAGPGVYFQNYFQYYASDRLNDKFGNKLPLPRTDLNVVAEIIQGIYISKIRILGASLGVSAVLPTVLKVNINDGLNNVALKAQNGFGDLFIGPALQFDPIMKGKKPVFVQRFESDFVVPTGADNNKDAINPGNNFWSFNPYWAATLWFIPQWSASIRLHYLWNAKSHNPYVTFGPLVKNTQAGQAVFANIATEYEFSEKLHIGINSYFFNQFTDTRANGKKYPGRREGVWAIGPGMVYTFTKNQYLFFNFYSEQNAINRPQATNIIVRYVLHF